MALLKAPPRPNPVPQLPGRAPLRSSDMGRLTAPNRNRGLRGTQALSANQKIDSGARTILTLPVRVIGLGGYRSGVEATRPSEASRTFLERRPDGQPCHGGQSHPAPDQGAGSRNLTGPGP